MVKMKFLFGIGISYLSLMNELTANPYVISGTTNGVVKIWKNCFIQNQNKNENENENENENYNHHEKNENQNENENENQNENQKSRNFKSRY
ncbi:hypothetical protein M0811_14684 [Anaeramoeba ignava]|uniref:Uncharacterized protein n=1 Tax=Anaeramoeba ignava TaxID=1746090 RepID=A0A9Q0LUQ6_ANAIG|nr:hypothetical protein M0811_14684 [Anaeramoeba ignava]